MLFMSRQLFSVVFAIGLCACFAAGKAATAAPFVDSDWKFGNIIRQNVIEENPPLALKRAYMNLQVPFGATQEYCRKICRHDLRHLHHDRTSHLPEACQQTAILRLEVIKQAMEIIRDHFLAMGEHA